MKSNCPECNETMKEDYSILLQKGKDKDRDRKYCPSCGFVTSDRKKRRKNEHNG